MFLILLLNFRCYSVIISQRIWTIKYDRKIVIVTILFLLWNIFRHRSIARLLLISIKSILKKTYITLRKIWSRNVWFNFDMYLYDSINRRLNFINYSAKRDVNCQSIFNVKRLYTAVFSSCWTTIVKINKIKIKYLNKHTIELPTIFAEKVIERQTKYIIINSCYLQNNSALIWL